MPTADLKAFTQRLQQFADNYEHTAESIIRAHSSDIADLQATQLAKGINSEGRQITPAYSPFTVEQKQKYGVGLGRVTSHVTGFMTGETYKLLQAQVGAGKFTITANTFKFGKLEQHYGVRLFGLTKDSAAEFRDSVALPEMQEEFERQVLR